jgi:hypothetical protein
VAGDSWGETSIPLAIHQPWTMFILFAIMMTISLGCMNLTPGCTTLDGDVFFDVKIRRTGVDSPEFLGSMI